MMDQRMLSRLEEVSAAHKKAKDEAERFRNLRDQLMYRLRWRKQVPIAEIAARAGVSRATVLSKTPIPHRTQVPGYVSAFSDPAEEALVSRMPALSVEKGAEMDPAIGVGVVVGRQD